MTHFRSQFSLQTLLIAVLAFALGLAARNIASGLRPLTMQLILPSSTSAVSPGESLIVESLNNPALGRRVVVLADGTISLPYIGTVSVSGQDIAAVQDSLEQEYQRYFSDPGIQVYRANASEPLK